MEANGRFAWVYWAGDADDEARMATKFGTSVIPFYGHWVPEAVNTPGKCIFTGKPCDHRILMVKLS